MKKHRPAAKLLGLRSKEEAVDQRHWCQDESRRHHFDRKLVDFRQLRHENLCKFVQTGSRIGVA